MVLQLPDLIEPKEYKLVCHRQRDHSGGWSRYPILFDLNMDALLAFAEKQLLNESGASADRLGGDL